MVLYGTIALEHILPSPTLQPPTSTSSPPAPQLRSPRPDGTVLSPTHICLCHGRGHHSTHRPNFAGGSPFDGGPGVREDFCVGAPPAPCTTSCATLSVGCLGLLAWLFAIIAAAAVGIEHDTVVLREEKTTIVNFSSSTNIPLCALGGAVVVCCRRPGVEGCKCG